MMGRRESETRRTKERDYRRQIRRKAEMCKWRNKKIKLEKKEREAG